MLKAGKLKSCGNASRCIADIVMQENGLPSASIDTKGGFLVGNRAGNLQVTMDMGKPRFDWDKIPLSEKFGYPPY